MRVIFLVSMIEIMISESFSENWLRALPQQSPAGFEWNLTVSGNFQSNVNYQCWFDFQLSSNAESELPRSNIPTFKSAVSKPASPSTLVCSLPVFGYAESTAVLSVYNVDTISIVSGPPSESTASLILFTAGWLSVQAVEGAGNCKRCTFDFSVVACNLAKGGGRLKITGFGFDATASDYVCKFLCSPDINPLCNSDGTFVQGPIPSFPSAIFLPSSQTLYCNTPLWPFDSHALAGRTRLVIEKGGVRIPLYSSPSSGGCVDYFDFLEGWDYSKIRLTALATAGSAVITISGYGFDTSFRNYTCAFTAAANRRGTPAVVAGPLTLVCPTPTWDLPVPSDGADFSVYKQSCAGANGASSACDESAKVRANDADSMGKVFFLPAVASLAPSASSSPTQSVTVLGGGFDPSSYFYTVRLSDTSSSTNFSVSPLNASSSSLAVALSSLNFTPNRVLTVAVFQSGQPVNASAPAGSGFTFLSSVIDYVAPAGARAGTAAGGQSLTVIGSGFLANASAAAGGGGYACEFHDASGSSLRSQPVPAALSESAIVCVTPAWGLVYVASNVSVSLLLGAYRFPGPGLAFAFLASWDSWSRSAGPIGGGADLVIGGYGLDPAAEYQCEFSFSGGEAAARSAPARALSRQQVVCVTPRWPFGSGGLTALLLLRGGLPVPRSRTGATEPPPATYEFVPGFAVWPSRLAIGLGQTAFFSVLPDTQPTGPVLVEMLSSDQSVATVATPVNLSAVGALAANERQVAVRCSGTGVASISMEVAGANYDGRSFGSVVEVRCKGALAATPVTNAVQPGGTVLVPIRLLVGATDSPGIYTPGSDIVFGLSAAGPAGCSAAQANFTFLRGEAARKDVTMLCGVSDGRSSVTVQILDASSSSDPLFEGLSATFDLYVKPALLASPRRLTLRPGRVASLSITPTSAPTLKTMVRVDSQDPTVAAVSVTLVFPTGDVRPRIVPVARVGPGSTAIRVTATSPDLLDQVSAGCDSGDGARCAAGFAPLCDFGGYGGANQTAWALVMRALSRRVGVADCTIYDGCLRAACCGSTAAQTCVSAVVAGGCRADWMLPAFSGTESPSTDWGWLLASNNATALYRTWVSGFDCQAFVACAWHRCFPGGGNYDFVMSDDVAIVSIPGFSIAPSAINLNQGDSFSLSIQPEQVPLTQFILTLTLFPRGVAVTIPSQLLVQNSTTQTVRILWASAGRASLRLFVSENASNYAGHDQIYGEFVSCSPGFTFYSVDISNRTLPLPTRNGSNMLPLQVGSAATIWISPAFSPTENFQISISTTAITLITIEPAVLQYQSQSNAGINVKISLQAPMNGYARTVLRANVTSKSLLQVYILDSGVGYTRGSMLIDGYGGYGFMGTYSVSVVKWDFYCTDESPELRTGGNYTYNQLSTFSGPLNSTYISIGACFLSATPLYTYFYPGQKCIHNHTGMRVPGCNPRIYFDVLAGHISALRFEGSDCLVTGITCQLSLNGLGGNGFAGYFQTGITSTNITSNGSGYSCDWACFARLITDPLNTSASAEAANSQGCPIGYDVSFCSNLRVQPQIFLGNISSFRSSLQIQRIATASIFPSTLSLQVLQTGTFSVVPSEAVTGNVSFVVTHNSSRLSVTNFSFSVGDVESNIKSFSATHLGGGAQTVQIMVDGIGSGNFDGFHASVIVQLMPGISFSNQIVNLQQYPGTAFVSFSCDTPPTKDTLVIVVMQTDFGKDVSDDSFGRNILRVNDTVLLRKGQTASQTLILIHGGIDGSVLENKVAGTALIWFQVSDPESNYHGINTSRTSIAVSVLPGFESNIKQTFKVAVQKGMHFDLILKLDHPPLSGTQFSVLLSNNSLAHVSTQLFFDAGDRGPKSVSIFHVGLVGTVSLSLLSTTDNGNYINVSAENYLRLDMLPGFVFSTETVAVQYQEANVFFSMALDSTSTADTIVFIESSDPSIAAVTSSVHFSAATRAENDVQTATVTWVGPGIVTLTFIAASPGGNYDRVTSGSVNVICYRPLSVSASKVVIQKGGESTVYFSIPMISSSDTKFIFTSSPIGVVQVSQPIIIPKGVNTSFPLSIYHIKYGSATVRISALAPGGEYNGVSFDVQAMAMPGFTFSTQEIILYSCFYSSKCETTFSFSPDQVPTSDMNIQISTSLPTLLEITPNSVVFASENGISSRVYVRIRYLAAGVSCLSFAVSSLGNYDQVATGGINVRSMPDLMVQLPTIFFPLGADSRNASDFDPANPAVYVQNNSYTVIGIYPSVPPTEDFDVSFTGAKSMIILSDTQLHFKAGSLEPQKVTISGLGSGSMVLSLKAIGGNYDGVRNPNILLTALPSFAVSNNDLEIPFHGQRNITISSGIRMEGSVNISIVFDDPGFALATPSLFSLVQGVIVTVTIRHLKTTVSEDRIGLSPYTYARIVAASTDSNYNHVQQIIRILLLPSGFDLSATELHVQRYRDSSLDKPQSYNLDCQVPFPPPLQRVGDSWNTFCGSTRLYLTPNDVIRNITRVLVQSSNSLITIVSQAYPNNIDVANGELPSSLLIFYPGDGPKYFEIFHKGQIGVSYLTISAGGIGFLSPFPLITVVAHGAFTAPVELVEVQRQSIQVISVAPISAPDQDSLVHISSSNGSAAIVLNDVIFAKGDLSLKNITVFNVNPGIALLSIQSESAGFVYGGAAAVNAIQVQCLRGFQISELNLKVQASPTNNGITNATLKPDYPPSSSVLVTVTSSDSSYVQVITETVLFPSGSSSEMNVSLLNVRPGTAANPVIISFTLTTDPSSNYFGVIIPQIEAIPLGTFIMSNKSVAVQKGMGLDITISPNIPPDEDTVVQIIVSNQSVVVCSRTVQFLAQKLDSQVINIQHVSAGYATISLQAYSSKGNYNGSRLDNAVSVQALVGFMTYFDPSVQTSNGQLRPLDQNSRLIVQMQPTSPLSYSTFLFVPDIFVDQDTYVEVLSSNSSIVKSLTEQVLFAKYQNVPQIVTIQHGGAEGQAFIYFNVLSGSNYMGIKSGHVNVLAMPGFLFSKLKIDVQKGGFSSFLIIPDSPITGDVTVSIISSDPSIAVVDSSIALVQSSNMSLSVTIFHQSVGTVALSFFASGANYDGVSWTNGVVAACRPGFILSPSILNIQYAGTANFTLQPDTEPSADITLTVISSQPVKAAANISTIIINGGDISPVLISVISRCSESPGNCARVGSTVLRISAQSEGGNYDGVESFNFVVVNLLAPALLVSENAIFIQQTDEIATFSIVPTLLPNVDTFVDFSFLDPNICSVNESAVLRSGDVSPKKIILRFGDIGATNLIARVVGPESSIYADIDPLILHIRSLASFGLSSRSLILQPNSSISVNMTPTTEIASDVIVSLSISATNIVKITPVTFVFSPPRKLIGLTVSPVVGMLVVKSEQYQVWPRLGIGKIVEILNDNMNSVSVNWSSGVNMQENYVGLRGHYMLALYEIITQEVNFSYIETGKTSLNITSASADVNYNGVLFTNAITITNPPRFITTPSVLMIQYGQTESVTIQPISMLAADVALRLSITQATSSSDGINQSLANISQTEFLFSQIVSKPFQNRKTVNVSCNFDGSAYIRFLGYGGSYLDTDYFGIYIVCLPGFEIVNSIISDLSILNPFASSLLSPTTVPNQQMTVVISANDSSLIRYTKRIVFNPYIHTQKKTINIEFGGQFQSGLVSLSIRAYGGNYDGVVLTNAIQIHVHGPSIIVPYKTIDVHPESSSIFFVSLDTAPTAPCYILATSSNTSIITVIGPQYPAYDTSNQQFQLNYVSAGNTSIHFTISSSAGSTYGTVLGLNKQVNVQALPAGFVFSNSYVTILPDSNASISFGIDSTPDSTVIIYARVEPDGLVAVIPSSYVFSEGVPGQVSTMIFTWKSPGTAKLFLKSEGGLYQDTTMSSVSITSLPYFPGAPTNITVAPNLPLSATVTWLPPSANFKAGLAYGYRIEFSLTQNFERLETACELGSSSSPYVGNFSYTTGSFGQVACMFVRIFSRNAAGLGAAGPFTKGCLTLIDYPPSVSPISVSMIGNGRVGLFWDKPNTNEKLHYAIDIASPNGSLINTLREVKNSTQLAMEIPLDTILQVQVQSMRASGEVSLYTPTAYFLFEGPPLVYHVPLNFTIMPITVQAHSGTTSQILVIPDSAPSLDILIDITSSEPYVATVTDHILFSSGNAVPQQVVVYHLHPGYTNISFSAVGGLYSGLSVIVAARTLLNAEPSLGILP